MKLTMKVALVLASVFASASPSQAQQRTRPLDPKIDSLFPSKPANYLTDLAKIVKDSAAVNHRLGEIRKTDKLSLVVVTLPSIGDRAIEDVAREIGRKWMVATANDTIGAAVRNTGGVILLVPSIRKCRLEVATGSEGYMTDSRAANACRDAASYFRSGDFGAGFISIANTFAKYHRAELAEEAQARRPKPPSKPFPWELFSEIVIIAGLLALFLWHRWMVKAAERRAEEDRLRAEAQRQEKERERRAEAERQAAARAEAERRARLTPEERLREDQERAEAARRRAEEERVAAIAAAELAARRRREEEEDEENRRRTSTFSSSSDSSSSSDFGGGWSSGGSDSFDGGGGGSGY